MCACVRVCVCVCACVCVCVCVCVFDVHFELICDYFTRCFWCCICANAMHNVLYETEFINDPV